MPKWSPGPLKGGWKKAGPGQSEAERLMGYLAWGKGYRVAPETECDSEVLGMLMARFAGSIGQRAARTARAAEGRLAMLGVWGNPARLLIVRKDNPLSFGESAGRYYFASLPEDLPGKVTPLTDNYAGVLTFDHGGLRHTAYSIAR
jgi:hypothetical protein